MHAKLLEAIRALVADIAAGRASEIEADGRGGRLSAEDLQVALREYQGTFVPLPDEAIELIDVYPADDDPSESTLDVPLWTTEEGESDLILQVVARKSGDEYHLAISSLYVH